jgi:Fur family ferric uptake transcriptional regulator
MTRQRRVILEEIKQTGSHPTAYEVYETVRRRLPRISLGTVYRNLELLFEYGEVQKLELGGAQRRFDGDTANHYHVRCLHCGRVDDVLIERLATLEDLIRGVSEYEIVGHRLEFLGLCPKCRKDAHHSHDEMRTSTARQS